jgi:hypothetical protein
MAGAVKKVAYCMLQPQVINGGLVQGSGSGPSTLYIVCKSDLKLLLMSDSSSTQKICRDDTNIVAPENTGS